MAETVAFWEDVDPSVTVGLNDFQKDAIVEAVNRRGSDSHAADIRLSAFGYFLVVLFGRERRDRQRLKDERHRRPVFTIKNLAMILVLWGSVIYTIYSLLPHAVRLLLELFL
ncbi:MAG: hypothetical protein ACTSU0_08640 [Alphaproteobacteria bacterium]